MRTIQILRKTRPRSCGRVSSQAYYEWKCYHNQLWLFPEHQVKPEDAVDKSRSMEEIRKEGDEEHRESIRRGPRKGDHVYRGNGNEFEGEVRWVDRANGMVCVYLNGKYNGTLPLDHFTNMTAPRGRTRWLLV